MERRISVGIFQPKYVDHLQRWSRIFRSEETETNLSVWIATEISGIFGIMESRILWFRCFILSRVSGVQSTSILNFQYPIRVLSEKFAAITADQKREIRTTILPGIL